MLKMDHVAIRVADLDRAIAFYTEKLGLALLFKQIDTVHHEAFAFLQLDGGRLELLQKLDDDGRPTAYAAPPVGAPFCPHVAFVTEDMDHLVRRFEREGIPIAKGPLEIPGTVRWIYVHDPDNNIVEFVSWIA